MQINEIELIGKSELTRSRLMLAAQLSLGKVYTGKELSPLGQHVMNQVKSRLDLFDVILAECYEVIVREPDNCLAHYIAGRTLNNAAHSGDNGLSISIVNEAIAHLEHILSLVAGGGEYKAIIFLPRETRNDPGLDREAKTKLGLADLYHELGLSYMEVEMWHQALSCYKEVTTLDPQKATGWSWLSKSLFNTEGADQAIKTLEYALSIDSADMNFKALLGSYLRRYRRIASSRDNIFKALEGQGGED